MIDPTTLAGQSTPELLRLYTWILDELRVRGVQRSTNNPAGDYAEWLVKEGLGLDLADNSIAGYDAIGPDQLRYQVKGRRLTAANGSRQLGTIRGMRDPAVDPFDILVGVLFSADFTIARAAAIPIEVVRERARWQQHVNGYRLMLLDSIWSDPRVVDITERLRAISH